MKTIAVILIGAVALPAVAIAQQPGTLLPAPTYTPLPPAPPPAVHPDVSNLHVFEHLRVPLFMPMDMLEQVTLLSFVPSQSSPLSILPLPQGLPASPASVAGGADVSSLHAANAATANRATRECFQEIVRMFHPPGR